MVLKRNGLRPGRGVAEAPIYKETELTLIEVVTDDLAARIGKSYGWVEPSLPPLR